MRYIILAAACTLAVTAALLAIPPVGQPHSSLAPQTAGDRMAIASATAELVDEALTVRILVEPPASLPLAMASADIAPEVAGAAVTTSTAAPDLATTSTVAATTSSTTSTTTTTTTTTTTNPPTSTTPPTTSSPALGADSGSGGVIISPRGIVLPVLEATNDGWRVQTPCANETVISNGTRVSSVDFVIDPGHGGSETGAALGATVEKDLNLRIARIVEWYLEEAGYSVLLTRTTDVRLPLRSRAEIANAVSPKAFVSIHHNGGATRRQETPGTEIFSDGANPEAKRLGALVFEELTGELSNYDADWVGSWRNGVGARFNDAGEDLYGIHRYTPGIPSIITEAGYLSNPTEADLFVDNDVQWAHGRGIAVGMMRWLTSSDKGTGYLDDFVDAGSSGTGGFDGCTDPSL